MKTRALEKYELEKVFNYIKNGGNRNGVRIRANPQINLSYLFYSIKYRVKNR